MQRKPQSLRVLMRMDLGLNSTLDMSDLGKDGRFKSVFSLEPEQEELWAEFDFRRVFKNDGQARRIPLNFPDHNLSEARAYLMSRALKAPKFLAEDLLFLSQTVDTMKINPTLLTPSDPEATSSETDLLAGIWGLLLIHLFGNSPIKLKIDGRALLNHQCKEYDFCVMEVGHILTSTKVDHDGAKLLREDKNMINQMVKVLPDDSNLLRDAVAFGIQTVGLSGIIDSLHLVAPAFYVAVKEASFELPTSMTDIEKLKTIILAFLQLRDHINGTTGLCRNSLLKTMTFAGKLAPSTTQKDLGCSAWTNALWYKPSKNYRKQVYLMPDVTVAPVSDNARPAEMEVEDDAGEFADLTKNVDIDEYGWGRVKKGRAHYLYNI
ncbi:hypothetical protein BGX26_011293 [Mortierella sp. AD094]|nr:hypothetical protein BGX26_011293 [Mortierella sp. AD094]